MLILNLSGTSPSEQGFLVKVELSMALVKIFSFDISCFVNYILSKCYHFINSCSKQHSHKLNIP